MKKNTIVITFQNHGLNMAKDVCGQLRYGHMLFLLLILFHENLFNLEYIQKTQKQVFFYIICGFMCQKHISNNYSLLLGFQNLERKILENWSSIACLLSLTYIFLPLESDIKPFFQTSVILPWHLLPSSEIKTDA